MFISDPHHIIAIGASAGGLEEIKTFFDHTPFDGVSYVIVQHLSSEYKSRMRELLSKHSKLVVQEAQNGMRVLGNQVYLIPNDMFMTIRGGSLYLIKKENPRGPHMTINTFFTSLATDYGQKAIAVILSGMGSDGSAGIKAIKKAGGLVMVRNPENTEFNSMPSNAIATGMVDFILEPEAMPGVIDDYVKREIELLASGINDDQNVDEIIAMINQHLPLDFSDYKHSTILRRIQRRAASNNFGTLDKYLEFAKLNPEEFEILAKDFLISVTAFFRDTEAFAIIEKEVLPLILKGLMPKQEIRIWVTGCATGEEAYSIAMLVCEQLGDQIYKHVVKIFATDVDSAALAHAGKGLYTSAVTANIPQARLKRFFNQEQDGFSVKPELRKMIIFAMHDLVKNPPYCNMHLITCRNLLIYMTPVLQKKIYLMLLFGLQQDGYLFLGSSENPMPILQSLEVVNKKWKVYKNIEIKHAVSFESFTLPEPVYRKKNDTVLNPEDVFKSIDKTLGDAINETVMKDLGQLIVCIDHDHKIVKSYGDTTKFLIQKILTSDLTELLPPSLVIAFKTISSEVVLTNQICSVSGITIQQGENVIKVSLSVSPVIFKSRRSGFFVVRLSEDKSDCQSKDTMVLFDEKLYVDKYALVMEQENRELKEKLQVANEKLYSLNENMQSFNEELLSSNEEMQSTNEEMQSVNEELHTINTDYQFKNKELLELNDDLNNYFRSNINGQLFIDRDLHLIRFSPSAVKLINLLEGDIGRPISNISTNFKFENLIEDIRQVLCDDIVVKKEIEANDGRWYQVMTMPYIQELTGKTTGAVVTFNDVSELKKIQKQLDEKNQALTRINEDLDNFVHTSSHDLLAPLATIEGSIAVMNQIGVSDPELGEFLTIINASIKNFRILINEIALVAKIEDNTLDQGLVDIEEMLDNIQWSLEDKINSTGAIIKRDLKVKQILFSKKNLRSIFFNLISNGLKYKADRPPVLIVRANEIVDHTVISIQDNGIGIHRQHLDKIFDKYTRLGEDVEGYGIGLYLAKKMVNASGGTLEVESEFGKGSKFTIYLNNVKTAF